MRTENINVKFTISFPIDTPDKNGVMYTEVIKVAIEALDKQIPAKIVKTFDRGDYWCSCPVCCKGLGWEHNVNIKYCPECGQRLER